MPWASFYSKRGYHSGTQEVERSTVDKPILWDRRTKAFNVLPMCPPCFIGDGKEARPRCRCLARFRRASEMTRRCCATLAGCWAGAVVEPSRRPACHHAGACCVGRGGRSSPRRCLLSWLSWQLHGDGGCVLAGVGLAAAPLVSSARVLPGPRQGSCRGTMIVPDKGLAGGLMDLLGKDLTEGRRLLVLI